MTMQAEDERLGRLAYDAYCAQTGGVSLVTGVELPMWDGLTDELRTAWIAAARTVAANLTVDVLEAAPAEPEDEGDEVPETP